MHMKTVVINLIGGPCSGKSTVAAGIFYELKKMGVNCEMALEFAKDKVWEESYRTLDDQIYIFGKQYHKLWRLNNKVDVIITDSPLLVSLYYNKEDSNYFNDLVLECYNNFENYTYFLKPPQTYVESGRMQTEKEARQIGNTLEKLLIDNNIVYESLQVGKDNVVEEIVNQYLLSGNFKMTRRNDKETESVLRGRLSDLTLINDDEGEECNKIL